MEIKGEGKFAYVKVPLSLLMTMMEKSIQKSDMH